VFAIGNEVCKLHPHGNMYVDIIDSVQAVDHCVQLTEGWGLAALQGVLEV